MEQSTLEMLEFEGVLRWLAEETHSNPGADLAMSLRPNLDAEGVKESWAKINEARDLLATLESPDLRDHVDLTTLLSKAAPESARLDPDELRVFGLEAQTSTMVLAWFRGVKSDLPLLQAIVGDLFDFSELTGVLARTFGPDGEILDSASPRLAQLRLELTNARSALTLKLGDLMRSEEYKPVLMDELITTRNDRFVVPVRASAAGRRRGMVHDWSKSGQTAYLEPLETVEDNNRLAKIKLEERREIERILLKISQMCRELAPFFVKAGRALTIIDVIMAQARLAIIWRFSFVEHIIGAGLKFVQARHPLLERRLKATGRSMVPLDLVVTPKSPVTIVSGTNTGGKTVALKTLGLITVMALAGLPLPVADGSHMDFPIDVIAVMGDRQDMDSDLSTFSGHVKALGSVLDIAKEGVLVIIDELGSGTDPAEGAALGLAVLERLVISRAQVFAATHFHLIKSWAAVTDGVVSVSVNTSPTGQPVFGLSYGAPGFSGGLMMARRLGIAPEIIDRAESFLDDGHKRAIEILSRLDEERGALAAEREAMALTRQKAQESEEERREIFRREREAINREAREQAALIKSQLARNRREFEALKEELKAAVKAGRDSDIVRLNLKRSDQEKELETVKPKILDQRAGRPAKVISEGAQVFVESLGHNGIIKHINPEKDEYTVETCGLTVKVRRKDLSEPSASDKRRSVVNVSLGPDEPALSLNLLGRTVDEAEDIIDREIDRAIVVGRDRLTIIHGLGTGRLKQGIISHLRRHPRVRAFSSPFNVPGGSGITEVELSS
ncbi:MAG: Smr/MutS family protein [Deltaproteobacteria bacterium]|jgi:DNA mismatch repair protein MutS2|nr:Smr/MutS family protein [Deltaproteobacteria bacterium]